MTRCRERQLARALAQQRAGRISGLLETGRIKPASEIPEDATPAALELQNQKVAGKTSRRRFLNSGRFAISDSSALSRRPVPSSGESRGKMEAVDLVKTQSYSLTVKTITTHYAKTHLSRLLKDVQHGEEIIILNGQVPAGRLMAVGSTVRG